MKGFGRQKATPSLYRGAEYVVDFLPKVKLEMAVPDERVEDAIGAIEKSASTGKIGDGKIFVSIWKEPSASVPASPATKPCKERRR